MNTGLLNFTFDEPKKPGLDRAKHSTISIIDMDSAVMMFWFFVQSGLLDKQYAFYQQVNAFCRCSLGSTFPVKTFSSEFSALASWLESNQFLHGKSGSYFFCGKDGNNQGSATDSLTSLAEWISSHIFAGLSLRSIIASIPSPSALSSVSKSHLSYLTRYTFAIFK